MFTKWVLLVGGWVCNFGGFVSFLAGLFGFILAGTDMDNFGRQKFDSDGQFCASDRHTDTQTHGHTHLLLLY